MHTAAYVTAITAMCAAAEAASGSGEPGYCKDDSSCEDNYVCISVQTTRSGTEDVKQCLPYMREGDVCSGTYPGLCPSFSTWKTVFQSISSVCAYQLPSGTDQCLNDSFSGSNTDGFVSCMSLQDTSNTSARETYGVIFGCVDFDGSNLLFDKDSDNWALSAQMNYTGVINDACRSTNDSNSDIACSGRGTCTPNSSGSLDYACVCNVGYNGTFCEEIESNRCTLESQCQAGTCNLVTQECECEEGTTGDQCAYCDPSSSKACGGRGQCVPAPSLSNKSNASNANTSDATADSSSLSSAVGSLDSDTILAGSDVSADASTRFLQVSMGNATTSSDAMVCECEDGYTGDQCTRKVDSSSSGDGKKSRGTSTSDATSLATSIAIVASAVAVFSLLN